MMTRAICACTGDVGKPGSTPDIAVNERKKDYVRYMNVKRNEWSHEHVLYQFNLINPCSCERGFSCLSASTNWSGNLALNEEIRVQAS